MSLLTAIALGLAVQTGPGDVHLLVVSGVGGQPHYRDQFYRWGAELVDAARDRYGLPSDNVTFLAEQPDRDPTRIAGRSAKSAVLTALETIAGRAQANDRVFVVLIGHGTGQNGPPRFNLPGPDLTVDELAAALALFPTQTLVVANTASSSGEFVGGLSGENRIVLAATKSRFEGNETIFAEFFVQAFAGDDADVDKDERVSVLEAFTFARREVARRYEEDNKLLTEHAVLDDNGDGEGSDEPSGESDDGALARRVFLTRVAVAGPSETADPALVALYNEKQALEVRIAELRQRRQEMSEEAYEAALEELVVELGLTNREIRRREGRQ